MSDVDWDVLKLQYEILHEDPQELALENNISPHVVERAIRKGDWKRMAFQDVTRTFTDLLNVDEIDDKVVEQVEQRTRMLYTLKRAALNPKVILLEATIIQKAIESIKALSPTDPLASKRIADMTKVLEFIRPSGPAGAGGDTDATPRISVNIMNRA